MPCSAPPFSSVALPLVLDQAGVLEGSDDGIQLGRLLVNQAYDQHGTAEHTDLGRNLGWIYASWEGRRHWMLQVWVGLLTPKGYILAQGLERISHEDMYASIQTFDSVIVFSTAF